MVRLLWMMLIGLTLMANPPSPILEKNCMACHVKQQIPSELIYRRYLMKYSTDDAIKKILLAYLKSPSKETSIMPTQFFLKFPQKEKMDINETLLAESIDAYLDYFDIKKRLARRPKSP
jgi:hypothetical protein